MDQRGGSRARRARAPRRPRPAKLRQAHRRQGLARRYAHRRRRLAQHQEFRAGGRARDDRRRPGPLRRQNHEVPAQGENLRRLPAQLVGADLGRGVFDACPSRGGRLGAGDVGGARADQGRQPIYGAVPGQTPQRPQAGSVEGYRTAEAELAGSAQIAAPIAKSELVLGDVERFCTGRLAGGIERDLLDPRLGLAQQLLATTLERLATLIDGDRLLERYLALLEPLDDRFEFLDRPLEGEALDVGMGVVGHERVPVSRTLYNVLCQSGPPSPAQRYSRRRSSLHV